MERTYGLPHRTRAHRRRSDHSDLDPQHSDPEERAVGTPSPRAANRRHLRRVRAHVFAPDRSASRQCHLTATIDCHAVRIQMPSERGSVTASVGLVMGQPRRTMRAIPVRVFALPRLRANSNAR